MLDMHRRREEQEKKRGYRPENASAHPRTRKTCTPSAVADGKRSRHALSSSWPSSKLPWSVFRRHHVDSEAFFVRLHWPASVTNRMLEELDVPHWKQNDRSRRTQLQGTFETAGKARAAMTAFIHGLPSPAVRQLLLA
jgi:hypothetical protein